MAKKKITEIVEEITAGFLAENGLELYNSEFVKEGKDWFLRVYIDRLPLEGEDADECECVDGGESGSKGKSKEQYVSTDDCEKVSRFLSEELDRLDPIEQNYYLLGTVNGWSVAQAIKLNHSDKDVYDDPAFSIKVDISAADAASGWWWKIVPESTYATGNWVDAKNASFGVAENGSEELSGMLVGRTATEDCGAGCLKVQGPYLLTINLEEGTYKFEMAIDNLYPPGDSNNWSHAASQMLFTKDYANYYGYANLNSIFKFTSAPNWDGINYGNAGEGVLSTDGGAGNLTVAEPGLYWLHVNLAALTYEATLVKTIGLIGDATPNGWGASTALTPSADNLVWTGEVTFGAGEFKFRANNEWTINLGGSMDDLQQDGANIGTPGEGTYTVTLDLRSLPYKATFVKK